MIHYKTYFTKLTGSDRAVPLKRARTFFLRSGISQNDLNRVLTLIRIGEERNIDLMQFCAAMHLIIANVRLSVDVPSDLPPDLALTLFSSKTSPPPKPCKTQKTKTLSPPPKPCKTQKPKLIQTVLRSYKDLTPLEIEGSRHWVRTRVTLLFETRNHSNSHADTETRRRRRGRVLLVQRKDQRNDMGST